MSQVSHFNPSVDVSIKTIHDRQPKSHRLEGHISFPHSSISISPEAFPRTATELVPTLTLPDANSLLIREDDVNMEDSTLRFNDPANMWQLGDGDPLDNARGTQTFAPEPDWFSYLRKTPFLAVQSPSRNQGCGSTQRSADPARIYPPNHGHVRDDGNMSLVPSISFSLLEALYVLSLGAIARKA